MNPAIAAPASAENQVIADALERIADLLAAQDASPFRVRAYRNAARTARECAPPLRQLLDDQGIPGLVRLPAVGRSIAAAVAEFLRRGRIGLLDRLEGEVSPEDLLTTVPGVGEELAARIHDELGVETLEELELAAHDGRLAALAGFGERRVRGIRETLAGMLGRAGRLRARGRLAACGEQGRVPVATLLELDRDYRRGAEAGELRRIAPRRFNPSGEAWLPVLHRERDGCAFTVLYSNTARAHELGRTRDWVVIYCERDGEEERYTVVTERRGAFAGRRVVRGREPECATTGGD